MIGVQSAIDHHEFGIAREHDAWNISGIQRKTGEAAD